MIRRYDVVLAVAVMALGTVVGAIIGWLGADGVDIDL